ncbi:glycosyl transferase family 2 [Bordetella genomosp. 1]|uniref:Glycosyl transferase family 2 n=1 Tax=Bordetella genomosp. 1 TaxID=1395607 RepID=A0A261RX79_9BORD|nr:glycosyltransferase family A protein [Bordetella genomosp. 1]OZI28873.1 glycosyl transferase family 2 [Bordetella genomosp. 1]
MTAPGEKTALSVVVPTYKRPDLLARCLDALVRQQLLARYEILVCDDAACDATRRQVEEFPRDRVGAPALRYLAVSGSRGPSGARNLGWRSAEAEIIAFTDDDTIPHPDWLAQGLRGFGPDVAAVTGITEMPIPDPPSDYERDASGLTRAEFITANCFVRRSALLAVGGFDTRYTMAWREDSDLQFALLDAGFRIARCEHARVEHPVRPVRFAAGLGMQKKVMFDMLLRRKYPALYQERIRQGPRFYLGVTAAFLLAAGLFATGHTAAATAAAAIWAALTAHFFVRRLRGTCRSSRNVIDLAITSACIPLLSVFWRTVGLLRFGRSAA